MKTIQSFLLGSIPLLGWIERFQEGRSVNTTNDMGGGSRPLLQGKIVDVIRGCSHKWGAFLPPPPIFAPPPFQMSGRFWAAPFGTAPYCTDEFTSPITVCLCGATDHPNKLLICVCLPFNTSTENFCFFLFFPFLFFYKDWLRQTRLRLINFD